MTSNTPLQQSNPDSTRWNTVVFASLAGFLAYFAMYAFRKPFTAAVYPDETLWNTGVQLKTAFVVAQIFGYAVSKYIGIDVCSRLGNKSRGVVLIGLIVVAELMLVLFAALPMNWKVVAIFANGVPLGMVWGLVVRYLEGRRCSDFLLAALCCSFVVSSGIVKDVGRYWLYSGVETYWMPAVTGLCFLPVFFLAVWMLESIPNPTRLDEQERQRRTQMSATQRSAFLRTHWSILWPMFVLYTIITAYRDFRDNYAIEMLNSLGYEGTAGGFSAMELPVGLLVTLALGGLMLIRDNARALIAIYSCMVIGMIVVGLSTWLSIAGQIDGMTWIVGIGIGAYLTYLPFNAVLFERMVALGGGGTAVFGIYLADALGYTGSVGVQLYKDLAAQQLDRLTFFQGFSLLLSVIGICCLAVSGRALFASTMFQTTGSQPVNNGETVLATATTP
ncbi:DUF5690 family protein [Lacunimicrobium album]